MTAETDPSPATDPEEQSSSFSTWRVVLAAFLVAVVGVIVARLLLFAFAENFGFAGKSLWAYLDVFLVPVFVAAATIWLTVWENRRQRRYEAAQQELQDKADQAQKDRELEVARQQAQDAALQAYLDQMSQMLADKERPLRRSQPGDSLSLVAEVRTRTVLRRLDGKQKRHVVQFLSDAGLIQSSRMHLVMAKVEQKLEQAVQLEKEGKRDDTAETQLRADDLLDKPLRDKMYKPSHQIVLSLKEADLSGAELSGLQLPNVKMFVADLRRANLSDAGLQQAKLSRAKLMKATLHGTSLSGATLWRAHLNSADLSGADLNRAWLKEADLQHAILRDATLSEAYMAEAKLQGADLTGVELFPKDLTEANMTGAKGITDSELFLFHASYGHIALTGATMPNGQKYEDWLKDKEGRGESLTNHEKAYLDRLKDKQGRGVGGENSGPS